MTTLKYDYMALYLPRGLIIKTGGVRELGPRLILDGLGIDGLDSSPSVRRETPDRAFSHGTFPEAGTYAARYLTFSGYAWVDTPTQLYALRDSLRSALDPQTPGEMTIKQAAREARTIHYYGAELTWERQTDTRARWRVELYCPDPRLYGVEKTGFLYSDDLSRSGLDTTQAVTFPLVFNHTVGKMKSTVLTNEGNATAYPVYRFNGNTEGFSLSAGGNTLTYAGATAANMELRIDTFAGEVRYGTSDRSYLLSSREWITIPPESALSPKVDFIASGEVEGSLKINVSWRDTYL